jgi:dGTP triphosphohydrolase
MDLLNAKIRTKELLARVAELEATIIEQADKLKKLESDLEQLQCDYMEIESKQASKFLKFVKSSDKIGNITKLQFHALFVAFNQAGDL